MQLPLNTKQKFEFACYLIVAEKVLSVVVGVVRFLVDTPLDFHDTNFSAFPSLFKV